MTDVEKQATNIIREWTSLLRALLGKYNAAHYVEGVDNNA